MGLQIGVCRPRLSEWVYSQAREPKALHILPEATHSLRQRRDQLWEILIEWLEASLPPS